jgi:hypothetical protein
LPASFARSGGIWLCVGDRPERVLAGDLAVDELEQVATAHLDALARHLRAAECPLGYSAVTPDPVAIVAVVEVRDAVEPRLEPFTDLRQAHHPPPPSGRRTAWHVEDAILAEAGHDRVEIAGVERVEEGLEQRVPVCVPAMSVTRAVERAPGRSG